MRKECDLHIVTIELIGFSRVLPYSIGDVGADEFWYLRIPILSANIVIFFNIHDRNNNY